jgi:hypothetical protein
VRLPIPGDPPSRIARTRVLGADIHPARPRGPRGARRGPRTPMSTRQLPRRRRTRAPRRQQPGKQPPSGERHKATTRRLPPMRRHHDRAPPAVVLNDSGQASSVAGRTAPAADPVPCGQGATGGTGLRRAAQERTQDQHGRHSYPGCCPAISTASWAQMRPAVS